MVIRDAAFKAVKHVNKPKPFKIEPLIKLDFVSANAGMVELAELVPGTRRVDGRTVFIHFKEFSLRFTGLCL